MDSKAGKMDRDNRREVDTQEVGVGHPVHVEKSVVMRGDMCEKRGDGSVVRQVWWVLRGGEEVTTEQPNIIDILAPFQPGGGAFFVSYLNFPFSA